MQDTWAKAELSQLWQLDAGLCATAPRPADPQVSQDIFLMHRFDLPRLLCSNNIKNANADVTKTDQATHSCKGAKQLVPRDLMPTESL